MNKKQQANGYNNYITYYTKMLLDNDEGYYKFLMNIEVKSVEELREVIKELVEENIPTKKGMWGDIISYAKSLIDVNEIAEEIWRERGEIVA